MRIWCCLGFGEGDEEEACDKSGKMSESDKERILGNNDMDESGNVGDGGGNEDGNENVQLRPGSLMEGCSSSSVAHGDEPSCSWGVPGTESDEIDRGVHFKRPKVRSLALEWDIPFVSVPAQEEFNLFGLIDEEYTEMINSAGQYVPPVSDGEESEHPADITSWGVNGDEHVSPDMDFMENGMDLTDDLLHMVFSFLDQINLCKAAKVCRQWRAASTHEDFWRFLNFEDRNISPQQFEDMCSRYPNATQVNIKGSPAIHTLAMQALSLRNLEILTLGIGQLGVAFFSVLRACTMLETLIITDAVLGNGNQAITIYHDRLRRLQVVKCHMTCISVSCPELETLSLKRSSMARAVLDCPLLRDLDIASCLNLLDAAVRSAATSCPLLESLDMSNCSRVSDETLREITNGGGCPMLKSLVLDNCLRLKAVGFNSNSLTSLSLAGCRAITSLDLTCPYLEQVSLDGCDHLENATFCPVGLQFLNLGICPKLNTLNIDAPNMVLLELVGCGVLSKAVIKCNSLTSLSFTDCRAITSLELTCRFLEQVSLDGCVLLENATFCPVGLQSLNLGICPKLNTLNIDAPSMVLLELKGCGVLSKAVINCPLLKSLDASFCSQLKDDFLSITKASCPRIESLILMSCPSIGSEGLVSLHGLPHLTSLDLSYTLLRDLQPVFDSCLQLKVLKLQACKNLRDSSLEPLYKDGALPTLLELDLSYATLCQAAIDELLACCTHLTHLSLNGCVNMHAMNWSLTIDRSTSPDCQLQNLNCVGCPNIKKVIIPSMACFSHLSSLNLSLSVNLKEVDVACSSLRFLNLSNCCSLESLKLECPKLNSLFLQSCNLREEAVESAISQCIMLETLHVCFCPKISPSSMGKLRRACPSLKSISSVPT